MALSMDDIVRRLTSGEDLESVARSLLPDKERELLRRLAVVRAFDQRVFETVLRPGIDGEGVPAFANLAAQDYIEAIPGAEPRYRLRAGWRSEYFRSWWPQSGIPAVNPTVPEALQKFSRQLADYYANRKRHEGGRQLEVLFHLVLVDQVRALKLFKDLYESEDKQFNLAGCQDVIDAVGDPDRRTLLSQPLRELLLDRQQYLRVRGDWSIDFYRTSRFLPPAGMIDQFEGLIEGRERLLHLFARGGMGKTMRLRWLTARHCIPNRIPVARIDFDDADPINAVNDPWLLLIGLATQLNDQLPGAPFHELLKDYGQYLPLLYPWRPGASTASVTLDPPAVRQHAADDVPLRFERALKESPSKQPVVLIFDTLEQVLLQRDAEFDPMLGELARLHRASPSVRLVLSGRYELGERMKGFATAFGPVRSDEVPPFSDNEAKTYLREIRGVTDDDLLTVIVRQADGMPFKLALFGDIVEQRPDLTAQEVDSYPDPGLLYLIERVVERIPDYPVRWLLRYGAIPRRLNFSFLESFLSPYLARAMAGDPSFDEPKRDPRPAGRHDKGAAFPTGLLGSPEELNLAALWDKLRAYASSYSWVSIEAGDTLSFHPDVVNPMRRMLRAQPAFRILHRDAANYFQRLASEQPDRWGGSIREAIYHHFQLEGRRAGRFWEQQLQQALALGRHDWRRDLANEVLRLETVGLDGQRRAPDDGSSLLPLSLIIRAHFELAVASADEALAVGVGSKHTLWSEATSHLETAERLQGRRAVISSARRDLLRARLLMKDGNYAGAQKLLEPAQKRAKNPEDKLALQTALGECLAAQSGTGAVAVFTGAVVAAVGLIAVAKTVWDRLRATDAAVDSARKLALEHTGHDRLDEAVKACDQALKLATDHEHQARPELILLRAELDLRLGLPEQAIERISNLRVTDVEPKQWPKREQLLARAALEARQPRKVLEITGRLLTSLSSDLESQLSTSELIEAEAASREISGSALAALAEFRRALEEWERARIWWSEVGDGERACRCLLSSARLQLREVGNLQEARQLLEVAESSAPAPGGDIWLSCQLAWVELFGRTGRTGEAREYLQNTIEQLAALAAPPRRVVRAALEGLALAGAPPRQFLVMLCGALEGVTPVSARLRLLDELIRSPVLGGAELADQLAVLGRLAPAPASVKRKSRALLLPDWALLTLRAVEVDRVTGAGDRARRHLDRVLSNVVGRGERFVELDVRQAADRLSDDLAVVPDGELSGLMEEFARFQTLQGVLLARQAASMLRTGGSREEIFSATEVILHRAERRLVNDHEIRSGWTARVWELRAQALQLRGEEDEADYLARMAVDVYEELGDWAKAGELRSRLDVRSRAVRPGPAPAAIRLRLLPSGGLEAEAVLPDTPRPTLRHYYPTHPLVHAAALANLTANPGSPAERVPFELLSRLAENWASLGANLGALLLDAAGAAVMAIGQAGGLSIEIEDRQLQAVPWELAGAALGQQLLSAHPFTGALYRGSGARKAFAREVRFAQIALNRTAGARLDVDGLVGSRTAAALRDFQAARRLQATGELDAETMHALRQELTADRSTERPPVAMILRASLTRQTAQSRGEWIQGFDVSRSYAMAGFLPYVVESPWIGDLEFEELAKQQPTPAVLHISSGFSASAGLLSLDFGEGNQTRGPTKEATAGGIAATTLDRFIQRLPAAEPRPLVILDVPRPPGPTEAARLLLLRNLFAADLFALRSTPIIVATGLTTGCTPELYDRLIGALADGRSAASAVHSVRQLGAASEGTSPASELPDEAALAATALFADAPSLGLVAAPKSGD